MMRKKTFFFNVFLFGIISVFFLIGSTIIYLLTNNVHMSIIYLFSIDVTFYIGFYLGKSDITEHSYRNG